jgi:toxin secretion/phage lysis holin
LQVKAIVIVITFCFIALDIVTGILQALKNKTFSSSVLREGGFHKMSFIVFILLAILCDYGQKYIDLGFEIPLIKGVCAYIIFTEITSIIENACHLNPKIVPKKIQAFFIKCN